MRFICNATASVHNHFEVLSISVCLKDWNSPKSQLKNVLNENLTDQRATVLLSGSLFCVHTFVIQPWLYL